MKVLLIDDEHALVALWREYLQLRGHDVVSTGRISEARPHVEKGWPDVVVVDFELPDGSAADVLELVSEHSPSAGTVLCSGHGAALPPALLARADLVLGKPLRLNELRDALDHLALRDQR